MSRGVSTLQPAFLLGFPQTSTEALFRENVPGRSQAGEGPLARAPAQVPLSGVKEGNGVGSISRAHRLERNRSLPVGTSQMGTFLRPCGREAVAVLAHLLLELLAQLWNSTSEPEL